MALIVVQAGHYPRTRGATGTGGRDGDPTEQEFNIAAAYACATHLRRAGHACRVIGADVADSLYRGDAFVAIHCDGSTSPSAHGASVGYRTSEGQVLAGRFKTAYQAAGWTGGWRPDNYTKALAGYYGTKNAVDQGTRRAFIAEAGFLTNPTDEKALSLPHGPERFARALTAAVVATFGGTQPQEDDPLSALTDKEQRELLAKVRAIFDETAANPDDASECRLKDTTILVRDLHKRVADTPPPAG